MSRYEASVYVTTEGKGRLWMASEHSQKQFTAASYSFPKRWMAMKDHHHPHHCIQMAIMETMIIYKWIQLWVCYSHTSSGSVASPAHLFGRLKANKMLLSAPQLLIKHTSHTGKYKQMTAAQEGAAGGDNSGLWLGKSMGISCRIRKCKYNEKMP